MKPRLLDLFSGAGGCAMGYHSAGFEVVGVDLEPQKNYPFTFIQADALAFLDNEDLSCFDVIHASPVCKNYTNSNRPNKRSKVTRDDYPRLIPEVRERLERIGKPYVIENVPGAKDPETGGLNANLRLCGSMFGLRVDRERLFEIGNIDLFPLPPGPCRCKKGQTIGVYGHSVWDSSKEGTRRRDGRPRPDSVPIAVGREAMGIDWMGIEELAQAIPPAYTEWIGRQLLAAITQQQDISA